MVVVVRERMMGCPEGCVQKCGAILILLAMKELGFGFA